MAEQKFEDRQIACGDCKQEFTFSAGEQKFYKDQGFTNDPKRCKPCRETRRTQGRPQEKR